MLFTAMDHGPPAVRRCALRELWKFPNPVVITTLTELLRDNNFKASPSQPDIEAAVHALHAMGDPRAQEFLTSVLVDRRWLQPVYRKEIREAVKSARESKERSASSWQPE